MFSLPFFLIEIHREVSRQSQSNSPGTLYDILNENENRNRQKARDKTKLKYEQVDTAFVAHRSCKLLRPSQSPISVSVTMVTGIRCDGDVLPR